MLIEIDAEAQSVELYVRGARSMSTSISTPSEEVRTPHKKSKDNTSGKRAPARAPCGECGSVGSRHFKKCSKSGAKPKPSASRKKDNDEEDQGAGTEMGPQTYNNVKMFKARGKHSKEISEQLDLSIREVNAAMSSSDYTHYLDIREGE